MRKIIERIKRSLAGGSYEESEPKIDETYVEISGKTFNDRKDTIMVRPFTLDDFSDIKDVLDALRDGKTIALINIKPLRDKDIVELKRAIGKLKKTTDAIEGDIAGFGEDWIAVVPAFAKIHRDKETKAVKGDEEGKKEPAPGKKRMPESRDDDDAKITVLED
ncbi:cell division protein SepF [Candidatus Woesearchaeota archaeon]|nr:cell division protein SepF [Candidatus Woesearchaeota archaeon]HIH38096.1 cell division protein SepF [Candidatus Woesearchaeota archaeon]HIH48356.1 cell division protein SepF [Candidatus Woesearchaeota archaeon]HIJ03171.1 cell division protein SepF [Candidatus Woesearchaeota archaeon]